MSLPVRLPRSFAGTVVAALLASVGGCAGGSSDQPELVVLAASSLRAPLEELADAFEDDHDVVVTLHLAGSADLVAQLAEGAEADVVATADISTMQRLVDEDLLDGTPVPFATNTLTIAVPPGNPAGVTGFADLAEPGVQVVRCAPQVPCGAAALRVEEAAGVTLAPVSEEQTVTDVLGKVRAGEADAGLVYVTDVLAAGGDVEEVALPEGADVLNTYPAAVVAGTAQADLAGAFLALLTDEVGAAVLADAGFGAP